MSGFRIDYERLLTSLEGREHRVRVACKVFAQSTANELVAEAKRNAPWTDRTGLSRSTIDSKIIQQGTQTTIQLRGNTPQFKYLELCHEKKYAILWPTVKKNMTRVNKAWIRMLSRSS